MPAALDVEQLRTFLTIAETGSFGRAARAADKTQAALSFQVRILEDRVGKPLFVRNGGGSRLTEDGWRLVSYARRMVYLSEETASAFADADDVGAIDFGIPDDYATPYLHPILTRFRQVHPDVEVSVTCTTSARIAEMALAGEIDLGLVTNRCPTEVETVHEEPLVWVASNDHKPERREVLPLAVAGQDCPWRKVALETLASVGRRSRIAFVSTNARAVSAVVLSGLAVTLLSESTADPRMRVIGKAEGLPNLPRNEIGIVRPWSRPAARSTRALADAIRAVFRECASATRRASIALV